jgi:glycine betaine/choline ABC-type transport system substrate-binding protein
MKKTFLVLALGVSLLMAFNGEGRACVGRKLRIGAVDNRSSRIIAQLYVVLIAERTGTTAQPVFFKNDIQMYQAASKNQVDFLIEDTEQAMAEAGLIGTQLNQSSDPEKTYLALKGAFEQRLNLIWLQGFPVRSLKGKNALAAAVIRKGALQNFPALPRVLNMLARVLNAESLDRLASQTSSDTNMKRAAEDFLKQRRLI